MSSSTTIMVIEHISLNARPNAIYIKQKNYKNTHYDKFRFNIFYCGL